MSIKCPACDFENPDGSRLCSHCAAPLPSSEETPSSFTKTLVTSREELTSGTTFARRYQIIKELGKGGMGRVYKALDREINEEVAVKLLKPEIAADKSTIERFRNELKIARKVTHKNVCRMHDIGKEEETYFITMEYVEGEELKGLIKRKGKIPEKEAIKIAQQICEGLAEAHDLGVIHRDLKPQNIMIDKRDRTKIMDFGIARSVEAPGVTMTGTIIGTPDYISPEQADGQEADQRSDIYSLGVMLYEMVTGSVPFKGDTALSVAVKHKTEIPSDPRMITPEVSEDLSWMIMKCMEKDREQRYQSADEVLSDLDRVEKGIPLDRVPVKGIQLFFRSLFQRLRERKIIQTLAAFIGGGFLVLEFVHWILIDHYHFPETTLDITFITLLCALICTLAWQWFRGIRRPRRFKPEFILIPLFILVTVFFDARLFRQMGKPGTEAVSETRWKNSIAVLPFVNMSADEEQEYFCDGLTEEMINRLSNIRELKVPARTSVFSFKGEKIDIHDVGQKLKVDKVLEGSVRKAGNQLRITAQLINVADGYHIWSEKWDCEMDDVFSVQDEISLAVVNKLKLQLLGDEKDKVEKQHTKDLDAYNLYLKGAYFMNRLSEESIKKGMDFFQQAIDRDPTYALAYAELARAYTNLGIWRFMFPKDAFPKAKALAKKALEIDETLGEAHASLAFTNMVYDWDWPAAGREFKRSIELNPGYASALQRYSLYLTAMRRYDESLKKARLAQELDPLSLLINTNIAIILHAQGYYDQAIEQCRKVLEMDPNFSQGLLWLGKAQAMKGDYEEAIATFQKTVELGLPWGTGCLGFTYGLSGQRDKAEELLQQLLELSKKQYILPAFIVWIYAGLGDADKTFEWIEKCYEEQDSWLYFFDHVPELDLIRPDPRFKAMLKRLNLE